MQSSMTPYQPGSNLDTTTAMLIGMKEKGTLQSYVAAHQGKPEYPQLLALATSINNISSAEQAAKYQPPTQTVAEQRLAALAPQQPQAASAPLPEEQGIGQLPARNLQKLAGGGIVAFGDGGEVPRYNGNATDGSQVTVGSDIWDPTTGEWVSGDTEPGPVTKWLAEKVGWKKGLSIDPAGGLKPRTVAQGEGSKKLNADRDAAMAQVNAGNYTRPAMQDDPRLAAGYKLPSGITSDSVALPEQPRADVGTSRKKTSAESATTSNKPSKAEAPAEQRGLGSLAEWAKEANAYTGEDPTAKQLARIDKQEASVESDKKDALNMALIKAGLGMMAGTSQHAFENIGKGAMGGLEDYASAMKDLKKAALERDKMRDAAEQAAYAYKRDDVKGYRAAQEKLADREADWKRAVLQADTTMRAAQTTSAAHLAAAQLPPKEAQMAMMFAPTHGADGKPLSPAERFQIGYPKFVEASADRFSPSAAYTKYLTTYDESKTSRPFMTFPEFLASMGYGGNAQPGNNANIRANPALGK